MTRAVLTLSLVAGLVTRAAAQWLGVPVWNSPEGGWLRAQDVSVEPYFSPGIRYRSVSGGGNSTEFGYAIGANVGFGLFGVHLAYDNEQLKGGGNVAVFGVGAHVAP